MKRRAITRLRRHVPDDQLPPVTDAGTGAPKRFKRKRRKKDRRARDLELSEMTPEDRERRKRNIAKMKAHGLVPGNPGNKGGQKGRSGRRPDIWLRWCQKLMLKPTTQRAIRRVIRDKTHPGHTTMIKMIRDSAFPITKNMEVNVRTSLEDILAESYKP